MKKEAKETPDLRFILTVCIHINFGDMKDKQ